MKEAACRICARELCGNQRRWIFHASAKVNLQVLLSHAVGHELTRDGRREFICSKCAFMLERVYRFDTVVARVEALSLERLQRLLLEKERLRQCISGMYHRNNPEDGPGADPPTRDSPVADLSALRYSDMIQDDLALSVYESWADRDDPGLDRHQHQCAVVAEPVTGQKPRRCRGCAALRVADSDYEAVCKVPRRIGRRSTSCGPPTRGDDPGGPPTQGDDPGGPLTWGDDPERESENAAVKLELPQTGMETDKPTCEKRSPSPGSSVDSLGPEDAQPGRDALWDKLPTDSSFSALETTLGLLRVWEYRPVKTQRGSKLPVLVKSKLDLGLCGGTLDQDPDPPQVMVVAPEVELADMEEEWLDEYLRCGPFRFQQRLMGGQKDWLGCYETAADQCVGELQNVQNQVQSLQAKIRESETRNKKLQNQLVSMELDLRSAREEAQQQERRIQDLSDTVGSKEAEAAELYGVIDEQNQMLHTLRELTNRSQLQGSGPEASWGQNEVLALQASLFQAQLELQATQRAQRRATRTQEDQNRALERLEDDLRGTLEHRRETERHNQELQLALQGIRTALQEREDQLRESEHQRKLEMEERERIVEDLRKSLQAKDQLLQDHQHESQDMKEHRDLLVQKLRQRVKERDRALERAVDEKFRFMEEKEEETLRVRLLLRDKERDLERQRRVLSNNQETITSLEVLVRGKVLELEQVSDACRSIQQQQQNLKDGQNRVLKERDAVIDQLQVALQARTQEAQDLRCSLLSKVHSTPGNVLEELKVRLHLKDRLFQEVLSDRTRQTREHQDQVKDLLGTISSRDRYIQESAGRFSEVVAEQTDRLQELRQQLSSGGGPRPDLTLDLTLELQAVQEELRLVLRKLEENQDLNRTQAVRLDALSRALQAKDDIITDLQNQLVDPSELPLVERLTQEVQNLREILQESTPGPDRSGSGPPEFGEPSSEDEEEELKSYYTESTDGDEFTTQSCGGEQMQSLTGVKHLVEQKLQVEKELVELKVQLEKAGFSSLSQMRKALFSLRAENEDLKLQQSGEQTSLAGDHEEEEELDVTIEEEEERSEAWDGDPSLTQDDVPSGDEEGRKNRNGAEALELLNTCSQGDELSPSLRQKMVGLQQQDKLMVSEHTVQTEDDRDLLTETAVQQDSKQIQVDLQDLGYETCGRSENEAERDDASSPEFDDLEMCTSLDCGSQWWPPRSASQSSSYGEDSSSLRRLVEDLRSQLTRSQVVIRGLQSRIRSLPTASDRGPPTPRKVSWSFQASSSQTGTEDDEGWQSSDGGFQASLQRPGKDLQDLASRVDALEEQLRKDGKKDEDGKTSTWTGKFDTLIQAQARELSHLRQRLREGRGVCSILSQHLGDTTKAFEELLRANDVDFYMGQSFREQLAQSGALAQRIAAKISGRDSSGDPEEKTELIAIRLSKELQQKDLLIESLKAKLRQNHRSDTPCSSHALSDTSDQSDRISYVSDERGSTNEDLELGSDMDAASELGHEDTHTQTSTRVSTDVQCCHGNMSQHPSVPPSITSSLGAQSCLSSSSMHCFGSPHGPVDVQSQTGFPSSRPLKGFPFTPQQPADFLPMSYPEFQPSPFRSIGTSVPDTSSAMRATVGPLENSALWDTAYGARPARLGPDPSSGSSGYQSGASHTGSDLMKEHLKEIRTLRQRLEDSIRTNDRLRQQLEERLAQTGADKGAPTNIYIQSLDSVGQLSAQVRLLQEENVGLQTQLKKITREGSREAEQLREALSLESSRLKEAELNAERWAGQNRKLQAEAEAHSQEVCQLKQDRQKNQETINRLQHEVSILEQQLCDSCSLVQSLQRDLQTRAREGAANTQSGQDDDARAGHSTTKTKDLRLQLEQQLEQQLQRHLSGRTNAQPGAQYYSDNAPSPPVRDSGLISPSCPLPPVQNQAGQRGAADKASDRVFPSRDGPHALWGGNHLEALQQQVLEGTGIILKMEAAISSLSGSQKPHHQPSDSRCVQKLLTDIRTLKRVLQEAHSLLQLFWKAAQPHPEEPQQEVSLREEVAALQLKLSEREQALKETLDRLRSSNLTKDSMERCILSQLSRTRDVLKTAKTNLQVRTQVSSITSPSLLVGVS